MMYRENGVRTFFKGEHFDHVVTCVHTTGLSPALLLNVPQIGIFILFLQTLYQSLEKISGENSPKNFKKPSNSFVHYSKLRIHYYYTGTIITRGACQWRGFHGVWVCVWNDQQSQCAAFGCSQKENTGH